MQHATESAPGDLLCRKYYEMEGELINGARGLDDWLLNWGNLRTELEGLKNWTAATTPREVVDLSGAIGVFHIIAVFLVNGYMALPALEDREGHDVIVLDKNREEVLARIHVVTSFTGDARFWPIRVEDLNDRDRDYCVLLLKAGSLDSPFDEFMLTGTEALDEFQRAYRELKRKEPFPCIWPSETKLYRWRANWQRWSRSLESASEAFEARGIRRSQRYFDGP